MSAQQSEKANVRFLLPKFDNINIATYYDPETTTVLAVKHSLIEEHIPEKVNLNIKIGALRLFSHGSEMKDDDVLSSYGVKQSADFPVPIQTMIRFQTKSFLEEMALKNQAAKKQNDALPQKSDNCSCIIFQTVEEEDSRSHCGVVHLLGMEGQEITRNGCDLAWDL